VSRTVFILTAEPPEGGGGVEHAVREMMSVLNAQGYQTEVFHRGNSEPAWLAKRSGPVGKKVAGMLVGYWVGRNAQRHMTEDVAAVISNSDVGYYPLHRNPPFKGIHFYHGTYRGQSEAIRPFITRAGYLYLKWWNSMVLERLSGRKKLVLTNSEQVSDEIWQFFGQKSVAVWLPIDTKRFRPLDMAESRAALGLATGKPVGIFVGSTHPMKGFPVVEWLIERLPEVHWILALRGNSPESHRAMPNVTLLQDVPHDRLPILYSAADFSVCPSLYEPFGYVAAEALACGTPVIASPGGASRLFLREPPMNRLLISNPSATQYFLDAIRDVLRDPGFYRRVVNEQIRPQIEERLARRNWHRRFFEATGL